MKARKIKLRDGRVIYGPTKRGKFTRAQIKKAVKAALEKRDA